MKSNIVVMTSVLVIAYFVSPMGNLWAQSEGKNSNAQAIAAVRTYWEARLSKCGGYSIGALSPGYIEEFKNFDFVAREIKITEIERMNGIEWRIRTAVKPGTPGRILDPPSGRFFDWLPSSAANEFSDTLGDMPAVIEKKNNVVTIKFPNEIALTHPPVEMSKYHPSKLQDCALYRIHAKQANN